jgi:hypothetical protein
MKQHFCPVEKAEIAYQDKCNWCGELESQKPVAHKDWCASLTQLLLTHPPKPALCNCTSPAPQRTEQNFCSRCGKRTKDLTTIHTCTPSQD